MSTAFEKDYILRIVRQLALFVARLLRDKENGHYEEAEDAVRVAYGEIFGIDHRILRLMRPEQLVESLGKERAGLFVELMAEEAELRALRGDAQTAALIAQQALGVVDAGGAADPRIRARLDECARGGVVG